MAKVIEIFFLIFPLSDYAVMALHRPNLGKSDSPQANITKMEEAGHASRKQAAILSFVVTL